MIATLLDDDRIRAIFHEFILPSYPAEPSDSPTLYMVGAQPGAGKTRAIQRICKSHLDAVEVNGDDLRVYHPDYSRILDEAPLRMPELTSQASSAWVRMSLDHLRDRHVSVVVETTFAHPKANMDTLHSFRQAGYRESLVFVAVPAPVSLLGILERYVQQLRDYGIGRWSDPAYHDQVVQQIPDTLECLIASGLLDEVKVVDRNGADVAHKCLNPTDATRNATELRRLAESKLAADSITEEQRELGKQSLTDIVQYLTTLEHPDHNVVGLTRRAETLFLNIRN
ncbi:Zeta toxin family protein [Bifidobacterium lemurum]|uniref:UDP-N-acetylglucosamine kinase n=1 Tax=Bifidobacterium lemurum TaxID=1603886 RepID=A0A261FQL6_9BIFI|nr:zeta toxin family protein [Bifidobacterium lemurum]OZG61481.1 Zeta toxin family protein [Bifidobacterium lemurum]QOL35096.1 zeta toxin family protein [Bifidobacterium lemurum]